ncbi:hydroxymyristoyl-ACP dehydratase [Telmatocola sphagniphila]|uniref:Hydroxymyristoyl-ACP dehydratase n=1 Tax=Telmatocola sphagniphila TaxID=1123043 RepID=A0A8E6EUH5_9BACT|nr:hydroxymyristoyl-ACP dehydratase [Telmatocola sphagniphila]QVL31267.1 hydroxymyristoyl-ACP dehydratase [Telmatocola sphagniphila]
MRFNLVDRIVAWEPGKTLNAEKYLTLGEEYLRDHFPTFPVMPGVLMLQSVVEASSWLWRISRDFDSTVIALREARNVKYGTFMEPGRIMEIAVELIKTDGSTATFRGKGNIKGGAQTVSAQIVLTAYNVSEKSPHGEILDEKLNRHWRERFAWLSGEFQKAN